MQSTDREEFKTQLTTLCAAYDRPVADRELAYWQGMQKMGINEFARVVEWCCGESGPDKLPTTKQCWLILRQLKTNSLTQQLPQLRKPPIADAQDNLEFFANRLLLALMSAAGGLGEKLAPCVKLKRKLVGEFVAYVREGEDLATPHEFVRRFLVGIDKISPISRELLDRWKAATKEFEGIDIEMTRPIPMAYIEGLTTNGQFDFSEFQT